MYPAAVWREHGEWFWQIQGNVHHPVSRPIGAYLFRRALGFTGLTLSPLERLRWQQRSAPFLAYHQAKRVLHLRLERQQFHLAPSSPTGHFGGVFPLPQLGSIQTDPPPDGRSFERTVWVGSRTVGRELSMVIHSLNGPGMDVITDVDDTIKITGVQDPTEALRNTFLRPFQPVPGLAARLTHWAAVHRSQMHYVTGSPWQLYGPLTAFTREQGFPIGSWAMPTFRFNDRESRRRLRQPELHKMTALRTLLTRAAERQFVCLGDSGERDPEIYTAIAREFPGRIRRIFIRELGGESVDSVRYRTARAGVSDAEFRLFRSAAELPALLW